MAHLRRRDLPRLILGDLVCSLYWFQPLVWLAARRSYLDLELACDRDVCASGVRGTDYARLLLTFAAGRVPAAAHGAAFARPSSIEVRMRHALRPHSRRSSLGPALSTAGAVAAVVLLTSVLVQPLAETPPAAAQWTLPVVEPIEEPPATTTQEITGSIHDAARNGDTGMVMTMIDRRPELLEQRDSLGMTPLAVAAWNDHVSLARLLIEKGADPNCRNTNGLTPLFCALDRGRPAMAHMLIDHGADISVRGFEQRSLLHMAARAGARGIVDILLTEGADINDTDRRGATPLDLAVWSRYSSLADYLVSRGGEHSGLENPHARLRVKKDIYLTPAPASLILK